MKTLGILSFYLFISSSIVLCRRIRREGVEHMIPNELSELSKLKKDEVQGGSGSLEQRSFDLKTPGNEVHENEKAPFIGEPESRDIGPAENEGRLENPVSPKRIDKMLRKAILKIITGDLTKADMQLLESLNYDADQVRAIREQEMQKRKNHMAVSQEKRKSRNRFEFEQENLKRDRNWAENTSDEHNSFDYEAYNNQATYDYETAAANFESTIRSRNDSSSDYEDRLISSSSTEILPEYVDKSINEPGIIFRISYNDSEFDSSSEEKPVLSTTEDNHRSAFNGTGNNFPAATASVNSSSAPLERQIVTMEELVNFTRNYFTSTGSPVEDNEIATKNLSPKKEDRVRESTMSSTESTEPIYRYENLPNVTNGEDNQAGEYLSIATLSSTTMETPDVEETSIPDDNKSKLSTTTHRTYKGLKWIQDNVYQVIPEYIDSLESWTMENETSSSLYHPTVYQNHDDVAPKNLTVTDSSVQIDGMQNNPSESVQLFRSSPNISVENFQNLTAYQQMVATSRQAQRQKMMQEIKNIVLVFTGRANTTINSNIVQPYQERMTMFSPTCEIPRNTDSDAWRDAYSINMQFQPNLTSEQHLVAAKLRLFKLPRDNSTATPSTSLEGAEEEEKKIRISVYVYTKPLRKNRSKKFLMDSIMVSLTTTGAHLVLDVKDSSRFWRANARSMSRNHGLVVLVEDQDGRPLQPSHYIQTPQCPNSTNSVREDEKASHQRVPALFIRACARYVRVVDGDNSVTYEDCQLQNETVSLRKGTFSRY